VSEIKLCLDEDIEAYALIHPLRGRGVDVATTSEAGLAETSDQAQLIWAMEPGRTVLTYNAADFCRLHKRFIEEGRHHAGIIVAEQQRHPVGEMMRSVLRLMAHRDAAAMTARLEFPSQWIQHPRS